MALPLGGAERRHAETLLGTVAFTDRGAKQMKSLDFSRYVLSCVAAAMLAECGGSQTPIGAPGETPQTSAIAAHADRGKSWMLPEAKRIDLRTTYKVTPPLLYATNVGNEDVTVYRATAKDPEALATITDDIVIPGGACVDGQGTLYVTNEPASGGSVSEYPLGQTAPSRTITDGINEPGYCAIDAKGNLWVANIDGPNVTEYLKGSTKPHTVITEGLQYPVGVAIDHSGNLYVGNGNGATGKNVEVYAPGSKAPSRTITNGVSSPLGLAVDANGTLYVANGNQNAIAEYRSGQGDPFQTITEAMDYPAGVTIDKKGTLYVSNVSNSTVVEFAPGSITPLKRQISKGLYEPYGIAYYPALLP
jgi:sugar lactone lactonase YvrE